MVDSATGATAGDSSSAPATPLELIREKEAVLSGRVLSAKREADEIVSGARKQAASIIETATEESMTSARERQRRIVEETEASSIALLADADAEATELAKEIQPKIQSAVDFVVKTVVGD